MAKEFSEIGNIEPGSSPSAEQLDQIKVEVGTERYANGKFDVASEIFEELVKKELFNEFLTLHAYEHVLDAK